MDPITISLVSAILSATGLGDWLKDKVGGMIGEDAAGKIIDVARTVTGAELPNDILAKLQADAAVVAKLREKLIDNEQEIWRLEFADRSNARAMQIAALNQTDVFSKRFIYYFAIAWSAFAMLYIIAITFFDIPKDSVRFADTILGFVLGTIIAALMQYFYGSSAANKSKDNSISNLAEAMRGK